MAFFLLLLFTWCGVTVFENLGKVVEDEINKLDDVWWCKVCEALDNRFLMRRSSRTQSFGEFVFEEQMSDRIAVALSKRMGERARKELVERRLLDYKGDDLSVLNFCQDVAIREVLRNGSKKWEQWLPIISNGYRKGARSFLANGPWIFGPGYYRMPVEIAQRIVSESSSYPVTLLRWGGAVRSSSNWRKGCAGRSSCG